MNAETVRTFLDENPAVFHRFGREALRVIRRGWKHYSARTIMEVMRHHSNLEADPTKRFKINDHLIPTLARDFMTAHPEAPKKFFELRTARSVKKDRPQSPDFWADMEDGTL